MNEPIVRNCLTDTQKMTLGLWMNEIADDTNYLDQIAATLATTGSEMVGRIVTAKNIQSVAAAWPTPITLKGTRQPKVKTVDLIRRIDLLEARILKLEHPGCVVPARPALVSPE